MTAKEVTVNYHHFIEVDGFLVNIPNGTSLLRL